MKEILREQLIQSGWKDELKEYCKEIIRRKGLEKVTVEELVAEITPHGRGEELLILKTFIVIIIKFLLHQQLYQKV